MSFDPETNFEDSLVVHGDLRTQLIKQAEQIRLLQNELAVLQSSYNALVGTVRVLGLKIDRNSRLIMEMDE